MTESKSKDEIEVTPQMIRAGVAALSLRCPLDVAFPVGGEEAAVEDVLLAAFLEMSDATLEMCIGVFEKSRPQP